MYNIITTTATTTKTIATTTATTPKIMTPSTNEIVTASATSTYHIDDLLKS